MKYARLNPMNFGIAWGIISAICVFFTTIISIIAPGSDYALLATNWLEAVYGSLGYSASYSGIIIGAVYGFIDVFIISFLFALIYNKLTEIRE